MATTHQSRDHSQSRTEEPFKTLSIVMVPPIMALRPLSPAF